MCVYIVKKMPVRAYLFKRKRNGSVSLPYTARVNRTGPARGKKRRNRRRGGRRGRGGVTTKLMRQPVPDKIMTKLRYSEAIVVNLSTPSVLGSYLFRTSIYDPDFTSLGHQPLWRDQLDYLYTKYRVHGIKYRLTIVNTNVNQLTGGAIVHQPDSTLETNLNTIRERRNSRTFVLNGASAGSNRIMTGFMHTGAPHGLTKSDFMADEDFEAAMNANPVKNSFLAMYFYTLHSSAIVHIQCDLTFYVELLGRVTVVGS